MISFVLLSSALATEPAFCPNDVLSGVPATEAHRDGPGRLWVEVDGHGDGLRFYGAMAGDAGAAPVIFLEGDVLRQVSGSLASGVEWQVVDGYAQLSPALLQGEAAQYAAATARSFVNLARPGAYGSSGHHRQRRREREVALVDRALDRLKKRFGWSRIDLAGVSGGGHLVAALMGRRSDIDRAVIASGNVAVRKRAQERGLETGVTGYADFVDPIDLVQQVARHPPRKLIMLTDPRDMLVSASSQAAYLEALRGSGVEVEQRLVPARDPNHHLLRVPAIMAALAGAPDSRFPLDPW